MKYIIDTVNNMLEIENGKAVKKMYYLSRNIISKVVILSLRDYLSLNKIIMKSIEDYSEDSSMLFHYKIIFGSKIYLIVYCIKQQMEDKNTLFKGDIFPVQFLINKMYGKNTERKCILCIIYKMNSSVYIIYSIKKSIVYSRIIDEKSIGFVEEIVKKDVQMINNELGQKLKFIVVSNVDDLRRCDFISRYLEDRINAVSI